MINKIICNITKILGSRRTNIVVGEILEFDFLLPQNFSNILYECLSKNVAKMETNFLLGYILFFY